MILSDYKLGGGLLIQVHDDAKVKNLIATPVLDDIKTVWETIKNNHMFTQLVFIIFCSYTGSIYFIGKKVALGVT